MLRGLKAHGMEVRVLCARQEFAAAGDPPSDLAIEIVDVPAEEGGWRARIRRFRRPVGELARSEFAGRVREAARDSDILHLEDIETAWLDEGIATPSILRLQYFTRLDRDFGAPWRRDFRQMLEFTLAEHFAVRRHSTLVAASPRIAGAMRRRNPEASVVLAPLCLDPGDYPAAPLDGPPTAGIIGTGD